MLDTQQVFRKNTFMKIKTILLSLVTISIVQGSELSILPHNSLGVFYPDDSKPLITAFPWDNATTEEISLRTKISCVNEKQFPVGNFVYLVNETNSNFNIEVIEYDQQLQKYNNSRKIDCELSKLNLQDCSYVVYNGGGGTGLGYDSLSLGAQFINRAYENKVPCVINYPTDKKPEILLFIKNKYVHYFPCWNDIKEKLTAYGFALGFLALVWHISPLFNPLFS